MTNTLFKALLIAIALGFTGLFCFWVIPPLIESGDIVGAFGAGFVNPYASGYAADAIACWGILLVWIVYEARALSIRHGWICALLGVFPGVAVGFALYLILRARQLQSERV